MAIDVLSEISKYTDRILGDEVTIILFRIAQTILIMPLCPPDPVRKSLKTKCSTETKESKPQSLMIQSTKQKTKKPITMDTQKLTFFNTTENLPRKTIWLEGSESKHN